MSLHFYTFSGNDWGLSPAVGFTEQDWATSMLRTHKMDELITRHAAIMDRYDPERRVGLSVSEWGAWWEKDKVAPSNLFQVGTLRDAVIAGLTLNIFHDHAERVQMANLAQMVNAAVPGADAWPQDDRYADVSRLRSLPGPPGRDPSSGEPGVRRPTASRAWTCPASACRPHGVRAGG